MWNTEHKIPPLQFGYCSCENICIAFLFIFLYEIQKRIKYSYAAARTWSPLIITWVLSRSVALLLWFDPTPEKCYRSIRHVWRFIGSHTHLLYLLLWWHYANVKVLCRYVESFSPQRHISAACLVKVRAAPRSFPHLLRPYNALILLQGHKATACIWRINVTFPPQHTTQHNTVHRDAQRKTEGP